MCPPDSPGPDNLLVAPVCTNNEIQCDDLQFNILKILLQDLNVLKCIHLDHIRVDRLLLFFTLHTVGEQIRLHVTLKNKTTTTSLSFPEWAEKLKKPQTL